MITNAIKQGFFIAKKSLHLVVALFIFNLVFNIFSYATPAPEPTIEFQGFYVAMLALFSLLGLLIQAGALGYIKEKIVNGNPDFKTFLKAAFKYVGRVVLSQLLVLLAVFLVALAFGVMVGVPHAFGAAHKIMPIITLVLAVIVGLIALYLLTVMVLAPYFIVLEDQTARNGIRRSVQMIKKHKKSVCVILAFVFLAALIGFALNVVGFMIHNDKFLIGYVALSALVSAFWSAFYFSSVMKLCQAYLEEDKLIVE